MLKIFSARFARGKFCIFIGVPSWKPPFFPLNFGDFFQNGFPSGGGGAWGGTKGSRKNYGQNFKSRALHEAPYNVTLEKKNT